MSSRKIDGRTAADWRRRLRAEVARIEAPGVGIDGPFSPGRENLADRELVRLRTGSIEISLRPAAAMAALAAVVDGAGRHALIAHWRKQTERETGFEAPDEIWMLFHTTCGAVTTWDFCPRCKRQPPEDEQAHVRYLHAVDAAGEYVSAAPGPDWDPED